MAHDEYIRTSDQKVFRADPLSTDPHPTIVAEDGEEDTVKWVGSNWFVSMTKGQTYEKS